VRYKVARGDHVRFDVAAILDFVGNYAGYKIGRQKVAEIAKTVMSLSEFPHMGTRREDIASNLRVIPSAGGQATICFTVDDDACVLRIVCVTYAGQDWERIAAERENQNKS
jgi:plasmid stabilization system protein ParE